MLPSLFGRQPALRISEMHRRHGYSHGTCADCVSLRELRHLHAVCTDAVPMRDWYDKRFKWNRNSPACGAKRERE